MIRQSPMHTQPLDTSPHLSDTLRATLLATARRSAEGAAAGQHLELPDPEDVPAPLRRLACSFVTASLHGRLRGCIGSLKPVRPLIVDVHDNARRAAVGDPRFPPIETVEALRVVLTVSVLGPARPLAASTEAELTSQIVPGRDGVILAEGNRRALFLPKVWETLPEPHVFLSHLRVKAGLPTDCWSPTMRAWRFVTDSFGEDP